MRYDTYHDTREAIFDMYQWYILSDFRPKKLISQEFGNFKDLKNINLSKNVSYEVSCN